MALATTTVAEGASKLVVSNKSLADPHHELVFYNPRMTFNRSLSSLAVGCALPLLENGELIDGLCSLGARGIRYLLENKGVARVTFVEANPHAIPLLKKNLALNKVPKKKYAIEARDFNVALANNKGRFDLIELDPFGSPVFYLDSALRRLNRRAVLSITATDLANLYGAKPRPAQRHYDARALRTEYSHELALRILLGRIVRSAALHGYAAEPLLSFFEGHAAKAVVFVERSAPKADEVLKHMGFVNHCPKCLHRHGSRLPKEVCPDCGARLEHAGPLWLGELCSVNFLDCLVRENGVRHYNEQQKISALLAALRDEHSMQPGYFDLHLLAQRARVAPPGKRFVLEALRAKGFKASGTHCSSNGVKTDAGTEDALKVVKAFSS